MVLFMNKIMSFNSKNYIKAIFDGYHITPNNSHLIGELFTKNALSWRQCAQLFEILEQARKGKP